MKKLQIVFISIICLISFNISHAESTIIYLKPIDNRAENIEKAREKLEKDIEANYKQLQDQLKSISARINTNQSISAQEEYEYQLQVYELRSELACMDKEGYYSSFNKKTKECECVEGSTFINGKCENELRLRLNNLLMCVKTFGPLAHYDYEKAGCVCDEGNEFDWTNNGFCTAKIKPLVENRYIPVAELQNTPKTTTFSPKPSLELKTTEEMASAPETPVAQTTPDSMQGNPSPFDQKTTLWQRLKISISKLKFW